MQSKEDLKQMITGLNLRLESLREVVRDLIAERNSLLAAQAKRGDIKASQMLKKRSGSRFWGRTTRRGT